MLEVTKEVCAVLNGKPIGFIQKMITGDGESAFEQFSELGRADFSVSGDTLVFQLKGQVIEVPLAEDSTFTTDISARDTEKKSAASTAIRTLTVESPALGIYATIDYRAN
jgi:hypothetical protein